VAIGRLFLSASDDGTARVWNDTRDRPITSLVAHENEVRSAALTLRGRKIITAANDKTARIWSLWPQVMMVSAKNQGNGDTCQRTISVEGRELNIRKVGNDFGLYAGEEVVRKFRLREGRLWMEAYCVSPNSKYLLMGTKDGMFEVVEIGSWETVGRFDLSALAAGEGLVDLRLSKDGKNYIASFPRATVTWPVMESNDELLAYARAVIPKTSATEGGVQVKITSETR
jgi:WD40 repeat protein